MDESDAYKMNHIFPHKNLVGIYQIKEFYRNGALNPDGHAWKNIAVDGPYAFVNIQSLNDSSLFCQSKIDTLKKTIEMTTWFDPKFKCALHYLASAQNTYTFKGILKGDSIHFTATKIDMNKVTLVKEYDNIRWLIK